jgi:hypothetical protein
MAHDGLMRGIERLMLVEHKAVELRNRAETGVEPSLYIYIDR